MPPNGFAVFACCGLDALGCDFDMDGVDAGVGVDPKSGFDDDKLANGFDVDVDVVEVDLEPNACGAATVVVVVVFVFVAVLGTKFMVPNGFLGFESDATVEVVVEKPPNGFDCFDDDDDDTKFLFPKGFLADVMDECLSETVDVAVVFASTVGFGFCGEEEDIDSDPRVGGRESTVDNPFVVFVVAFVVVFVGRGLSLGRGDPNHRSRLAFHEARSCFVCLVVSVVDVAVASVVDAGKLLLLLLLLLAVSRNKATGFTTGELHNDDDVMVAVAVDTIGRNQRVADMEYGMVATSLMK